MSHPKHNAHGFQPRAEAPPQQEPYGTFGDLLMRREDQLNGAVKMPTFRSESAIDDGLVLPHRSAPPNRKPTAPDLQLDPLKKLSSMSRNRAPANPFQGTGGSSHMQLALLQSIDESLRRLRQMAEDRRQTPSTFTPPEY